MSLVFRPATFYPVRYAPTFYRYHCAPAVQHYPYAAAQSLFNLFDDSFNSLERAMTQLQAQTQFKRPFNPTFNVVEADKTYRVEGKLEGFDAKDLSIEFLDEGHTLQIRGKTVSHSSPATTSTPATQETTTSAAVESAPAESSETASLKSHQATVEDEVEQPANASAAAEQTDSSQTVAESSTKSQAVTEPVEPTRTESVPQSTTKYTGTFTRTFRFASQIDQEAVKASLKDGILAITLPFARKPESRKIEIE